MTYLYKDKRADSSHIDFAKKVPSLRTKVQNLPVHTKSRLLKYLIGLVNGIWYDGLVIDRGQSLARAFQTVRTQSTDRMAAPTQNQLTAVKS